jgi:prevent-host-death family protein
VDVAVTELRANLSHWLACVRDGEELVVTDHGLPVARLLGLDTTATLEQLTDAGLVAKPVSRARPKAGGRKKPKARRPISDHVSEDRR